MLISLIYRQLTNKLIKGGAQMIFHPPYQTLTMHINHHYNQIDRNTTRVPQQQHKQSERKGKYEQKQLRSDKRNNRGKGKGKDKVNKDDMATILKDYRTANVEDQASQVNNFTNCCKRISVLYKKQNHQQFIGQKQQLQKLLKMIPNLKFQQMELLRNNITYIELLNILDFLRTLTRIQVINIKILENAKNKTFEIVSLYFSQTQQPPINQQVVLFCKLSPLYYPDINILSFHLQERLQIIFEKQHQLPFQVYQHYIIIKSLSKKDFLSYADKCILELVLQDLSARSNQIDTKMMTQLAKALIDLDLPSQIANSAILNMSQQLIELTLRKFESGGIKMFNLEHLNQCQTNQNEQFQIIMKQIYKYALEILSLDDRNFYPFNLLIGCLRHLPINFPSEDKQIVINRLQKCYKNGNQSSRKKMQLQLVQFVKMGYLSSEIQLLNGFISQPYFEFFWTLPCQYSLAKLIYPVDRLIEKTTRAQRFRTDINFIKAAVTVAIQAQLQPNNQDLIKTKAAFDDNISNASWKEYGLEWLVKLSRYHPARIRAFHKHYYKLYQSHIQPSNQNLEFDFTLKKNQNIKNMLFWQYYFSMSDYQSFNPHWLFNISSTVITLLARRQTKKFNLQIDPKIMLLTAIYVKLQQRQMTYRQNSFVMISLLSSYFPLIFKEGDIFLEIYFAICWKIANNVGYLSKNIKPQANYLIMRLLNIKNGRIAHSISYKRLISALLNNTSIFSQDNQFTHFKTAIVRTALQINLISQLLPHYSKEYFSSSQKDLVSATIGEYETQVINSKTLAPILKNHKTKTQFLKDHQRQIQNVIDQASLKDLEHYLIHFRQERGEMADNILLRLTHRFIHKMQIREVNVLLVHATIRDHLEIISKKTLEQFFTTLCNQLLFDMSAFQLVDHHQLLCILYQCKIEINTYLTVLKDYAINNHSRSSVIINILLEMNKNSEIQTSQHSDILDQYSFINPEGYLNYLIYHQQIIPNIKQKLLEMSKYQFKTVPPSLLTHFIQKKFNITLKTHNNDYKMFLSASQIGQQLFVKLGQQGIDVKLQQIAADKVYLIGNEIVLIFTEPKQRKERQLIEKVFEVLYPKRQITMISPQLQPQELKNLLTFISPYLNLPESIQSDILSNLSSK